MNEGAASAAAAPMADTTPAARQWRCDRCARASMRSNETGLSGDEAIGDAAGTRGAAFGRPARGLRITAVVLVGTRARGLRTTAVAAVGGTMGGTARSASAACDGATIRVNGVSGIDAGC